MRRLLLVALAALTLVAASGCGDDLVDESEVSGRAADLVVFMAPSATQEQVDGVRVQLELDRAEGTVERFEYMDEDQAREIAGVVAQSEGGQVAADVQTLYLVWLADAPADATNQAMSYDSMAGVSAVSTGDPALMPTTSVPATPSEDTTSTTTTTAGG